VKVSDTDGQQRAKMGGLIFFVRGSTFSAKLERGIRGGVTSKSNAAKVEKTIEHTSNKDLLEGGFQKTRWGALSYVGGGGGGRNFVFGPGHAREYKGGLIGLRRLP